MTDDIGPYTSQAEVVSVLIADNDAGALSVVADTADVGGDLSGDGAAAMAIYWGLTDGGTNEEQWANMTPAGMAADEQFGVYVSGLSPGQTYYYRASGFVSGQRGWASDAATFVTDTYEEWQSKKLRISLSGYVPPGETETPSCG
jgi:hypothetical protein